MKCFTCLLIACLSVSSVQAQLVREPAEVHTSSKDVNFKRPNDVGSCLQADCEPSFSSDEANLTESGPTNHGSSGSKGSEEAARNVNDSFELAPKRILGIVPNYRTTQSLKDYTPIGAREKFAIARDDSFDRGTFILGAIMGGEAQLTKSTPSFGQGASASGKYFGASFSDFVMGNYMTEAIFPTLFHQDPRYFRRGTGSAWRRLGSAVGQIFWTRADSGRMQFNFSEIAGASTGVAISNAYYPDNRNVSDASTRLGVQISADVIGNILKEFSPEISGLFSRKHRESHFSK